MRVLIVEDEPKMANLLRRGLSEQGIAVDATDRGEDALWMAGSTPYDAVVLDVMLPGIDGFETCRRLRDERVWTPVLMLTARGEVEDRVAGLDGGADDYLVKPFAFPELLARLRALSRRSTAFQPETAEVADLRVNLRSRAVHRSGVEISLSSREWDLLEFFLRNQDTVLDRASISSYVWDDNHDPASNALEVLVRRLRRKLDEGFSPPLIHTHRGAGYRFGV
jgi:two-component system OmpR family response regulator